MVWKFSECTNDKIRLNPKVQRLPLFPLPVYPEQRGHAGEEVRHDVRFLPVTLVIPAAPPLDKQQVPEQV